MSYAFHEVLPFLVINSNGGLCFNNQFFKDIISQQSDLDKLSESFNAITSEIEYETLVFNIPSFTGTHYHTNQVRSFEEKIFYITINEFETNTQGNEGKANTHYRSDLMDEDSGEKIDLYYYYDSDGSLQDIQILPIKKQDKQLITKTSSNSK